MSSTTNDKVEANFSSSNTSIVNGHENNATARSVWCNLLESAGESGGLIVSGLIQSEGEGERSRLVTGAGRPSARPAPPPNVEPLRWAPPKPSPGMPFSDRNSSRSTYCNGQHHKSHNAQADQINANCTTRKFLTILYATQSNQYYFRMYAKFASVTFKNIYYLINKFIYDT